MVLVAFRADDQVDEIILPFCVCLCMRAYLVARIFEIRKVRIKAYFSTFPEAQATFIAFVGAVAGYRRFRHFYLFPFPKQILYCTVYTSCIAVKNCAHFQSM